ncbi:UBX domain-containing protein 1, partial [Gonapodya sp. JEL0774]
MTDYQTLLDFGFPEVRVKKALKATGGSGLQSALDWLEKHQDDAGIDDPEPEAPAGGALGGPSDAQPDSVSTEDRAEGVISASEQTANSLKCEECGKLLRDASAAEVHAIKSGHTSFAESSEVIKPLSPEEKAKKVEELKARLAAKREARRLQEIQDEKEKEKVRRRTGQELTQIREKTAEKEMQKAFEDKKREKEEEKVAKARVKAQIEADKRDRQAKRDAEKAAAAGGLASADTPRPSSSSTAPKVAGTYTDARLQIRTADTPPLTHTFKADDTLETVYEYVASQRPPGGAPFKLSQTFPRKVLDGPDRQKTLKEL